VLLAISNKKLGQPYNGVSGISKGGKLIFSNVVSTFYYDLTKSLFQQTDEVKQQLLELLN